MRLLRLNLNEMDDEGQVQSYLKEQLQLPDSYGMNLESLHRYLAEEREDNVCIELIPCRNKEASIYEFGKKLEQVFENDAQTIDEKEGSIYAAFADTNPLEYQGLW